MKRVTVDPETTVSLLVSVCKMASDFRDSVLRIIDSE